MINRINIYDDADVFLLDLHFTVYKIAFMLAIVILAIGGMVFIYSRRQQITGFQKNLLKKLSTVSLFSGVIIFLLSCVVFLSSYQFSQKRASADHLMKLAEAESTLLQLRAANAVVKEPLVVDAENSQAWINSMRKSVSSGLTLDGYLDLVSQYNSMNIGEQKMSQWFKDNSSEAVYDEIKASMINMVSNQKQPMRSADHNVANQPADTASAPIEEAALIQEAAKHADNAQSEMDAQLDQVLN